MKKTWFKDHFAEIIALSFLWFAFFMFKIILLREVRADSTTQISIIEAIKGILFIIIGFYFGSSSGSKDKQQKLDKQNETPTP